MKKVIQQLLNEGDWVYLQLKNKYFYKCKIIELGEDSVTIVDRYSQVAVFSLDNIAQVGKWR